MGNELAALGEVIFEIQRFNQYMKVSAIHGQTCIEVSVLCPVTTPEYTLKQVALSKLSYVMRKQRHVSAKRWA